MLLPYFDKRSATAYTLALTVGGLLITGSPASLQAHRVISGSPGGVKITGAASGLQVGRKVNASPGGVQIAGSVASLRAARVLGGAVGSEKISGSAASLRVGRALPAGIGSEVISGFAADLVFTSSVNAYELLTEPGTLVVTGADAYFRYKPLPLDHPWGLEGRVIKRFVRYALEAGVGAWSIAGAPCEFVHAEAVSAERGRARDMDRRPVIRQEDEEALLALLLGL